MFEQLASVATQVATARTRGPKHWCVEKQPFHLRICWPPCVTRDSCLFWEKSPTVIWLRNWRRRPVASVGKFYLLTIYIYTCIYIYILYVYNTYTYIYVYMYICTTILYILFIYIYTCVYIYVCVLYACIYIFFLLPCKEIHVPSRVEVRPKFGKRQPYLEDRHRERERF